MYSEWKVLFCFPDFLHTHSSYGAVGQKPLYLLASKPIALVMKRTRVRV